MKPKFWPSDGLEYKNFYNKFCENWSDGSKVKMHVHRRLDTRRHTITDKRVLQR